MTINLAFGLSEAIPEAVTTAWGARMIFPNDLVHDRQDMQGEERDALVRWLNDGPLRWSRNHAHDLHQRYKISKEGSQKVILYKDGRGVIVASPKSSYGYLYIAAWLHNSEDDKQPSAEYQQIIIEPDPWENYVAEDDDEEDYDDEY